MFHPADAQGLNRGTGGRASKSTTLTIQPAATDTSMTIRAI
jgi:hypothetical protein